MKEKQFGKDWTKGQFTFPKHLTPEVVHTALFIHNAPSKEDIVKRTEYMAKQIGNESLSFAMALLVLPTLMDNMQHSQQYKTWQDKRFKSLN